MTDNVTPLMASLEEAKARANDVAAQLHKARHDLLVENTKRMSLEGVARTLDDTRYLLAEQERHTKHAVRVADELRVLLNGTREQLDKCRAELAAARSAVNSRDHRLEVATGKAAELEAGRIALVNEIDDLKEQLAKEKRLRGIMERKVTDVEFGRTAWMNCVAMREADINHLQEEIAKLRKQVADLEATNADLKTRLADSANGYTTGMTNLANLSLERDRLSARVLVLDENRKELEAKIKDLEWENQRWKASAENDAEAGFMLQGEINALTVANKRLKEQVADLQQMAEMSAEGHAEEVLTLNAQIDSLLEERRMLVSSLAQVVVSEILANAKAK